ncbi:Speckle-type POZ protein [Araneus ventricosus]|uniref:Speckle-type POZ protein n=1 Tax=Araneus ventricosus TaxID=182803 RepID=A0A4Y2MFB7_ARAVE|nr:Speckle-type POZ protein [Araneus ventricosus]GBN27554.1 Speckle-type POZ protein [Araneus ventricosus]
MADEEAEECTFRWKIENISHCWWLRSTEEIVSPSFIADGLEGTKWSLSLYPRGCTDAHSIGFYLNRERDGDRPNAIEVYYKLAFLDKDGLIVKERTSLKSSFKEKDTRGFPKYDDQDTVFVTRRGEYLPEDTLTVQCTLWNREKTPVKPRYIYARTVFRVNRRYVEWKIDKIGTLKSAHIKRYKDNLISFDLIFNEQKIDELKLDGISFDDSLKYISCRALVLDSDGKKENCGFQVYFPNHLTNKNLSFNLKSLKMMMENKSRYLPDDVLSFEFIFSTVQCSSCQKNSFKFECEPCVGIEKSPHMTVLIDDLKSMYNDALFTDTVLRTPTHEFPVHKAILSARSPVFNRMFSTDMMENNNGCVEITDFEDDTVHRMLLYMYTDSLKDLELEGADELYKIAEKYDIPSLKSSCSYFLKENLYQTNACGVLFLADQHNDVDLKIAAQKYIISQSDQFFESQEWEDFMSAHLKLAADVMLKKICPGRIWQ